MDQTNTGPFDVWVANQQVEFYVEQGSVPEVWFIMDSSELGNGSGLVRGSVTGHTISLP